MKPRGAAAGRALLLHFFAGMGCSAFKCLLQELLCFAKQWCLLQSPGWLLAKLTHWGTLGI